MGTLLEEILLLQTHKVRAEYRRFDWLRLPDRRTQGVILAITTTIVFRNSVSSRFRVRVTVFYRCYHGWRCGRRNSVGPPNRDKQQKPKTFRTDFTPGDEFSRSDHRLFSIIPDTRRTKFRANYPRVGRVARVMLSLSLAAGPTTLRFGSVRSSEPIRPGWTEPLTRPRAWRIRFCFSVTNTCRPRPLDRFQKPPPAVENKTERKKVRKKTPGVYSGNNRIIN